LALCTRAEGRFLPILQATEFGAIDVGERGHDRFTLWFIRACALLATGRRPHQPSVGTVYMVRRGAKTRSPKSLLVYETHFQARMLRPSS
jgi:hypothetical protein